MNLHERKRRSVGRGARDLGRTTVTASLLVALCVVGAPRAAEAPGFSATIHAIATGMGPVTGGDGPLVPLTIRIRDDASRIDFSGPRGEEAYLLSIANGQQRWLVQRASGVALPIPGASATLRVDPAEPCAAMQARCERDHGEVIAGIVVQGWRYRHAGGRGPDGTERGTLWVDPASGLVMGYRGGPASPDGARCARFQSRDNRSMPACSICHARCNSSVVSPARVGASRLS